MKTGKFEPRGKYAGAKHHLEPDLCKLYMGLVTNPTPQAFLEVQQMAVKIGEKLVELEKEFPNLLKERTPEEIKAELENEYESAKKKLEAMSKGSDWTKVKVEKPKIEAKAFNPHKPKSYEW